LRVVHDQLSARGKGRRKKLGKTSFVQPNGKDSWLGFEALSVSRSLIHSQSKHLHSKLVEIRIQGMKFHRVWVC
jgi:hypothetical protein